MIAQRSHTPIIFLQLLVLVLAAFAAAALISVAVDMTTGHALFAHASAATVVHDCIARGGTIQIWENPENGRRAHLCEIEPGRYGVQIVAKDASGGWRELTAFLKEKMTRIEQVMKYLSNQGYVPLQ